MFIILAGIALVGGIVIIANLYQARRFENRMALNGLYLLLSVMIVLIGAMVLLTAVASSGSANLVENNNLTLEISLEASIGLFIASLFAGVISLIITFSRRTRIFVQKYIVRSDGVEKRKHADSVIHTLALILMLFASIFTIGNFIIAGGIQGIAEELVNISVADLLSNFLMYVLLALLGVGIFIRRNLSRTLIRLGIRLPEQGQFGQWLRDAIKHLIIGAIIGFGMFWIQVGLSLIWQMSVSPETLAEQTAASQAMFAALGGSLWMGFLVAFTAGVGEELLFRGALQPIFGNLLVSIFFVMLHSQYILTPASLIILLVSLVFGFLRSRYTTPSAMMAHFVYNFTPFVLMGILSGMGISLESIIF